MIPFPGIAEISGHQDNGCNNSCFLVLSGQSSLVYNNNDYHYYI